MTVVRKKKKSKIQVAPAQMKLLKASLRQLFGNGLLGRTDDKGKQFTGTHYFLRDALDSRLLNS
jgi:hypothetical protein